MGTKNQAMWATLHAEDSLIDFCDLAAHEALAGSTASNGENACANTKVKIMVNVHAVYLHGLGPSTTMFGGVLFVGAGTHKASLDDLLCLSPFL